MLYEITLYKASVSSISKSSKMKQTVNTQLISSSLNMKKSQFELTYYKNNEETTNLWLNMKQVLRVVQKVYHLFYELYTYVIY
jgi:hypothetical protein